MKGGEVMVPPEPCRLLPATPVPMGFALKHHLSIR